MESLKPCYLTMSKYVKLKFNELNVDEQVLYMNDRLRFMEDHNDIIPIEYNFKYALVRIKVNETKQTYLQSLSSHKN